MKETVGGRAFLLWGPVVLYGAGITWLSHQPSLSPPLGLPDWPMHIAEYAGLAALAARALAGMPAGLDSGRAAGCLIACGLFAVLDEWHQSFVPGRHASAADVLADITGAGLALIAGVLVTRDWTTRGASGLIEIKLFGRQGCHLCDEAEKVLNEICTTDGVRIVGIHIQKIDVDADAALVKLYGDQVPVVTINGRKHFKYRVDPERLRRVLASIGRTGRR